MQAVLAAAAQIDRERRDQAARAADHMAACALGHSGECNCPALLATAPADLERQQVGQVQFQRIDDGREVTTTRPDPTSSSAPPITIVKHLPPRWICLSCGFSYRTDRPEQHACDASYVAHLARPPKFFLSLPPKQRHSGDYMLAVWRDGDGTYHLEELLVVAGQVVDRREVMAESYYPSLEGKLLTSVSEAYAR